MSAPVVGRRIGEPFNPWRGACGFYVPDVISKIKPMVIIGTRRKLSDPHKLLFTLLVRRAGKNGLCFPSIKKNLAPSMGHSERAIKIWIEDLEQFGLIARKRRGRGPGGKGLSNEYVFLWHPIYEVQSYPVPALQNRDYEVQGSDISKCKDEDYEVQASTPPYKEETCSVEARTFETHSSSSSSDASEQPTVPRKKKGPVSLDSKTQNPESAWYEIPGVMEKAAAIISESLPQFSQLSIHGIEVPTVLAILQNMTGLDDMKLWLGSAPGLHASAKTWGRYVADAKQWPARRKLTEDIVERAVPVPAPNSAYYESPAQPTPATPEPPKAPYCEFCGRAGVRQAPHDAGLWEWCTCSFADAVKIKHPNRVDEDNARVVGLRNRFGALVSTPASRMQ